MIREKDVVELFVPFPNIEANLAVNSHMYICHKSEEGETYLIKCQTFKNYMLTKPIAVHKVIEPSDIRRNPFLRTSLIDCDKLFYIIGVYIPEKRLTKRRRDVCTQLFNNVETELLSDNYITITIDSRELIDLNADL